MIAAVLNSESYVINRIVVDSLDFLPGLIDGENCDIGDFWDGEKFIKIDIVQP